MIAAPTDTHIKDDEMDITTDKETAQPPLTNRGVLNTITSAKSYVTLDWLTFTLPYSMANFELIRFYVGEGQRRKYGAFGYSHSSTVLDSGLVCWSPNRQEQKICVVLPASALAKLPTSAVGILQAVVNNDGNVTRVDFAIDDFKGALDMEIIHGHLVSGNVATRWKHYDRLTGKKEIGTATPSGDTIYVGSRQSESMLRIYDKKLEQCMKNGYCTENHWVRVELELKGKKALAVCKHLVQQSQGGYEDNFIGKLILGLIDFKEYNPKEKNKSRWSSCDWWIVFLGTAEKVALRLPKIEKTIEEVREWFEENIAAMMAVLVISDVDEDTSGYDWLIQTITLGQGKFKAKHKRLIDQAISAKDRQE